MFISYAIMRAFLLLETNEIAGLKQISEIKTPEVKISVRYINFNSGDCCCSSTSHRTNYLDLPLWCSVHGSLPPSNIENNPVYAKPPYQPEEKNQTHIDNGSDNELFGHETGRNTIMKIYDKIQKMFIVRWWGRGLMFLSRDVINGRQKSAFTLEELQEKAGLKLWPSEKWLKVAIRGLPGGLLTFLLYFEVS